MTNPVDTVLARLDKVREMSADKWMARCPAHEDRTPSLSIRRVDGKVLINCFAGCHPEDVLTAIGLTFSDLYDWPIDAREAAYYAAGRHLRKIKVDPLDHERMILKFAQQDLQAGREYGLEDRARVELALERIKEAGHEPA